MKRNYLRLVVACTLAAFFVFAGIENVHAQRAFGAKSLIIDDGAGHTETIQVNGVLGGNVTYNLPVPPTGNPQAGFVNVGTTTGQMLFWNGTNADWEAGAAPSAGAAFVVPPVVNFLAGFNGGTTYSANDLVTSGNVDTYYYSLQGSNTGNTPLTSPTFWQPVTLDQLKTIHKTLTLSAPGFTSLVSLEIPGSFTSGGRIHYTILATDGGSQIATEEGVMQYLATANSVTCTVQTNDKLHLGTVNSGCIPGFFNPGSHPGVSISDNVSFSTPASIVVHDVYFRIFPNSGQNNAGVVTPIPLRLEP